jgi:acetyl-CoA synthetase/acetyltransferase
MLRELKGFGVLGGARGDPLDVAALADALAKLSRLACDHADDVDSIDINPYLLTRAGGIALDAVIVPRRRAAMPPGAADPGAAGSEAR